MEMDLHQRPSLSQYLNGLADHAIAYGIGLGIVSAPVIALMQGVFHDAERRQDALAWVIVGIGAVGMIIAGSLIYAGTRRPRQPLDRALLLTMTVPFAALMIAATPFILVFVIGFFFALAFGLLMMPWAVVVTACWTAFYLALPATGRTPIHVADARAGPRSTGLLIGSLCVFLPCLAYVLWTSGGTRLFIDPPTHPTLPTWPRLH